MYHTPGSARPSVRPVLVRIGLSIAITVSAGLATPTRADAQATATLVGRVTDTTGTAITHAVLRVAGTSLTALTDANGGYRFNQVPTGSQLVVSRAFGFTPDTESVALAGGATVTRNVTLHASTQRLAEMVVRESPRMAETKVAALAKQQNANNLVAVLSGDEIRALPNFNAAEAAGRIPGVSLERDEGEGKFVQVRGTEPRLSNVTINGIHIPGTESDRIPKLDDVPSDLLAAIEVSKTLTADMDADAIGGSVNLVTKTPEGRPRGYIAGQYGQIDLLSRNTYQGGFTYGGRTGTDEKLGFLIGGSADRNNRAINDVEPAWGMYDTPGGASVSAPNEWSIRDYLYQRERYGLGGDLDYRIDATSDMYVKGLWSLFKNYGTRYVYDLSGDATPTDASTGTIPGVGLERTSQFRTPVEQMWAGSAGGHHDSGPWTLDYSLSYAGTRQQEKNYRTSTFGYTGPDLTLNYNASNAAYPRFGYQSVGDSVTANGASNYALNGYSTSDHLTTGRDFGGGANALLHYALGENQSQLKMGVRYRDERKDFTNQQLSFKDIGSPLLLQQVTSGFNDPNFYRRFASGFNVTPAIDNSGVNAYEDAHATQFSQTRNPVKDSLGSFNGSEKIYAAYGMNTTDFGALRVNLGLRIEATSASYLGHALLTGSSTVDQVTGTKNYTDLFPSAQLRYAVDPQTNVRFAVTRGIARPNYPDLAPNQSGTTCPTCANQPSLSGFTTGNPNLVAQHAWNYDFLVEHYLNTVGVISGGVFYKSLSDVILTRRIIYEGPGPFNGYVGFAPDNGGDGWLYGGEIAYTQRFVMLPGRLAGLGFDGNWTHTQSQVLVDPDAGRKAPLLRQSPNIANAYLTYDQSPFSARIGWTYNGAMIDAYGDGTPTANGDNYFYPHAQVDGSVVYNATNDVQLQFMVLNMNNAVFGFYQGTPAHEYSFQREYYGPTFFLGTKIGF
ncbi:MAG TPA: TonB-dependent receptor [Gemmatimonadaceae bacterium]|nr:TonB-dependent receptor [Gemmatimonadaceae bacterium]